LFEFFKHHWTDLLANVERELGRHVIKDFVDIHMDPQVITSLLQQVFG
jgi:hypothetical protein